MIINESDYKRHAIYRLWRRRADAADLIYVGALPVSQLLTLQDAREYANYSEYIKPTDATQIEIVNIAQTPQAAREAAEAHGQETNAPLNVMGRRAPTNSNRRKRPIICLETNERYASAAEACEQLGITPSSMSQHLRRKHHYGSVNGKHFHYADTKETQ